MPLPPMAQQINRWPTHSGFDKSWKPGDFELVK
jgi:hypothetical protein